MTTYNTMNPVPSADARDRYDNSQVFDEYVTGSSLLTPDRLGVLRKTWAGIEDDFANRLANSGFELPPIPYAGGTVIDRPSQLVSYLGNLYSVRADQSFPYTLDGTFATDEPNLVLRTDEALRAQLEDSTNPDNGAAVLARSSVIVESVVDLLAAKQEASQLVVTRGYHPGSDIGGSEFYWDPLRPGADHNGGTVISPSVSWDGTLANLLTFVQATGTGTGCWVKRNSDVFHADEFGLQNQITTEQGPLLNHVLQKAATVVSARYTVKVPEGFNILAHGIILPAGTTFDIQGVIIDVTAKPAVSMNARTTILGLHASIRSFTSLAGSFINAQTPTVTNSLIKILGFPEIQDIGAVKDVSMVGIATAGFYQSVLELYLIGHGRAVIHNSTLASYYHDWTFAITNSAVGVITLGELLNGGNLKLLRCNCSDTGLDLRNVGGWTVTITYIEGVLNNGIRMIGPEVRAVTIIGGTIEGATGATGVGISLESATSGVRIFGTVFGRDFATPAKRITATSNVTDTTYVGIGEPIFNLSGAISTIGASPDERVARISTASDLTPSVAGKIKVLILPAAGAGVITNFDDASDYQELRVIALSNNYSLGYAASGGLRLLTASNVALTAFSVVTFIKLPSTVSSANWVETSRSIKP
jgi:hypothetical protein